MLKDRRFALTTAFALLGHCALVALVATLGKQGLRPQAQRTFDVSVEVPLHALLTFEEPTLVQSKLGIHEAATTGGSQRPGQTPAGVARLATSGSARLLTDEHAAPELDSVGAEEQSTDSGNWSASEKSPIGPTLSLQQLGIGVSGALPTEPSIMLRDSEWRLAQSNKLERSLRQDAADDARQLGLGPTGPILKELEQLVQSSPIAASGWATIHARLLDNGVVEMELLGSSSDRERWASLLANARQRLTARKLSPPKASRGLDLELRVDSRVQMPSGADPGLDVKFLGLPLKKGEGKKPSKLELLSQLPRYEEDEGPSPSSEPKVPRIVIDVGKLVFDPVDIGANRRRMVRARVTRQTVL